VAYFVDFDAFGLLVIEIIVYVESCDLLQISSE